MKYPRSRILRNFSFLRLAKLFIRRRAARFPPPSRLERNLRARNLLAIHTGCLAIVGAELYLSYKFQADSVLLKIARLEIASSQASLLMKIIIHFLNEFELLFEHVLKRNLISFFKTRFKYMFFFFSFLFFFIKGFFLIKDFQRDKRHLNAIKESSSSY